MNPEKAYSADPQTIAVVEARHFVERTMDAWSLPEREEPVTAIVTELVANVVRHAQTPLEVRLAHRPGMVRIEVRDGDPRLPRLIVPRPEDEHNRGILLVDRYASRWGADAIPSGKVVWAEVAV